MDYFCTYIFGKHISGRVCKTRKLANIKIADLTLLRLYTIFSTNERKPMYIMNVSIEFRELLTTRVLHVQ